MYPITPTVSAAALGGVIRRRDTRGGAMVARVANQKRLPAIATPMSHAPEVSPCGATAVVVAAIVAVGGASALRNIRELVEDELRDRDVRDALPPIFLQTSTDQPADRRGDVGGQRSPVRLALEDRGDRVDIVSPANGARPVSIS